MGVTLTEAEITGAVTDLITGLAILPLLIPIFKSKCKNKALKSKWAMFFIFLSASSLVGFVAHYVIKGDKALKGIWVLLNTLLFFIVISFVALATEVNETAGKKKIITGILIAALPTWLYVIIAETFFGRRGIIVYVVFATVVAIFGFVYFLKAATKKKKGALTSLSALIPLLPAAFIQIKHDSFIHIIWDLDHNGIAHILILVSVFILFAGAMKNLMNNEAASLMND